MIQDELISPSYGRLEGLREAIELLFGSGRIKDVFDDDVRVRLDDAHGDLRQGEAGEADGTGEADNVGWKG